MKTRQELISEAEKLVKELTIEEKVHLLSGADDWHMAGVERLGLKPVKMSDGPNGLRTLVEEGEHKGEPLQATCFPSVSTVACSFDTELTEQIGKAVATECLNAGVSVLLGPGCNIKRSPLCGRNFEYPSEDPLLAGEITAGIVRGAQSEGIFATTKHFACNNQEKYRMVSDSIVDDRTLREIYLKPFEIAIKKGKVGNVMCSYNQINVFFSSDSHVVLTEMLRDELGFDGMVVSDWGAMNDWIGCVEAGMDLAMPGGAIASRDAILLDAIKKGKLSQKSVDTAVQRCLVNVLRAAELERQEFAADAHHALAAKAAGESAVLLENNGILPLKKGSKIAVLGEFAKVPKFQGAGSAQITPIQVTSLCDTLDVRNIPYTYAEGIGANEIAPNEAKIAAAVACAAEAGAAVVLAGLPDGYESEAGDRPHIYLPESCVTLINCLTEKKIPTVVVLVGGSCMDLPFRKDVDALLLAGLTGQNNGDAIADLLFGNVNPSGRLAETYPLGDQCQKLSGFGDRDIHYTESIYVGYRYYDKVNAQVAYPFGYGLSYTTFAYSDLKLSYREIFDVEDLTVTVTVTNTGFRKGKEVVQVYVQPPESTLYRAKQELKGFCKVELEPGESKTVNIQLPAGSFSYYNALNHCWHTESGNYSILVCKDSRTVLMRETVTVRGDDSIVVPDYRQTAAEYYDLKSEVPVSIGTFRTVYGKEFPAAYQYRPFHLNSTLGDILKIRWVSKLYNKVKPKLMKSLLDMGGAKEDDKENFDMEAVSSVIDNVLMGMPLRNLVSLSGGALNLKTLKKVIGFFNLTAGKQ